MDHPVLAALLLVQVCISQAAFVAPQCVQRQLSPEDLCGYPDLQGGDDCMTLSEAFGSADLISPGDCLEFRLSPGDYYFTEPAAVLDYSIVITAPTGGVTFTCECTDLQNSRPFSFRKAANDANESFVTMESLRFRNCHWPLQFDDVDHISISECTFSNFVSSAVDVYNCWDIHVDNSTFENNTAINGTGQFRANSGGLSIAYHTSQPTNDSRPVVRVTDSVFKSNKALLPMQNSSQQINLALNDHYYFGRGGGFGIFIDEAYVSVSCHISGCTFVGNNAESFGGGLYLYVDGNGTYHNFSVSDSTFLDNSAGAGSFGGGIQVALLIRNLNIPPTTFNFSHCKLTSNTADFGAGLSVVQVYSQGAGNSISLSDSTFINNTANEVGSAVMFASLLYVQNRMESLHYKVRDCVFTGNNAPGGTFGAGFTHIDFSGENTFSNNRGPGLRVVGSLIRVQGTLNFSANDASSTEGGALYISAFGQVKMYKDSEINFIDNRGRIGSAIVVVVQRSSVVFSELVYNPQCFLLYENTTVPPDEWTNVTIRFHGNEARVGPAVYISHLSLCSWFSVLKGDNDTNRVSATFSPTNFTNWAVFQYDNSSRATAHTNASASPEFYFQTEATKMTSKDNPNQPISIRPGQTKSLSLVGLDQFKNPTYVIVRLSDSRSNVSFEAFSQAGDTTNNNATNIVRLDPALIPVQPSDEFINITYGFPDFMDSSDLQDGVNFNITVDTPYNIRSSEPFSFAVQFADCQPGYVLHRRVEGDNIFTCSCEDNDFDVLTCDEDDEVIVLRDGLWAGQETEPHPHLHVYPCPVPYCSCLRRDGETCETLFFQEDPNNNRQCHATRRGTLCGECVNGTGVGILRGNCRTCHDNNYFALGLLVIADIAASGLVLFSAVFLHYVFPHSLKGFLFYVQTVYYATEYFPSSFWDIRQYMLYLGSVVGFYFPWDFCLYPEMHLLEAFGPRFIPPFTAAVVVGLVLVAVFCCFKKHRRRAQKRIWHGVWALVLVLYAPLAYTCSALLHCPRLPGEGSDEAYRWFLEGQVKCFRDSLHIALGILAILGVILLSLMIPAICIFTLVGKSSRLKQYAIAERLYEALTVGYKEQLRWWGAWDLLRRLLLIVIIVALPGRTVASLYVLITAFTFHLFLLPYEKWWHNLMEAAILANYILLLLLRSTQTFLDNLSPYSGTSVPEERGKGLTETDRLTWLFFPFLYLPVFGGLAYCIGWVGYRVVRLYKDRRMQLVPQSPSFVPLEEHTSYEEFTSSQPSAEKRTSVTSTVVDLT